MASNKNTDDCSNDNTGTWGCFLLPTGCNNSNCEFIVKWKDQSSYVDFQLITFINTTSIFSAFSALGFSDDKLMVTTSN